MSTTAIKICNMALARLGDTNRITSFTDSSEQARNCDLFYDLARKHTLASFPWNFACKFETLGLLSNGDPQGFAYAYQLPSDYITARNIFQASPSLGEIDFKVVGLEVWTDQEDAVLEYTYNNTVENAFDSAFITAVGFKLAADLAMPLTRNMKIEERLLEAYFGYLSLASGVNAREGLDTKAKIDDFLSARS